MCLVLLMMGWEGLYYKWAVSECAWELEVLEKVDEEDQNERGSRGLIYLCKVRPEHEPTDQWRGQPILLVTC